MFDKKNLIIESSELFKKDSKVFLLLLVINFLFLWRINLQGQLIGWDTTDGFLANFLYLVDCIKNGFVPIFNHYTLGGVSFSENMATSNAFNIIDLFLALLSLVFNPLYLFQLQYTVLATLSAYWLYTDLKTRSSAGPAFVIGLAFSIGLLPPLIGQASFFFSLVLFPFLIGPFKNSFDSKSPLGRIVVILIVYAMMIKGAFFLVALVGLAAFLYAVFIQKQNFKRTFLNYTFLLTLYLVYALPTYLYLKDLLPDLVGNFIAPDPRIRSLVPSERFYYDSLFTSLLDAFDGRFNWNRKWSIGINSVFFVLFFVHLFRIIKKPKLNFETVCLFVFVFFALVAGKVYPFNNFFESLPILGSNRWGFAYIYMSQLALLGFTHQALINISNNEVYSKNSLYISLLIIWGCYGLNPNSAALLSSLCATLFVYHYVKKSNRLFTVISVVTVVLALKSLTSFDSPKDEWKEVATRNPSVIYTQNTRDPGKPGNYEYWNRNWVYNKIPTLNGYNNVVHPIFWYLKGTEVSKEILIPLCSDEIWNFKDRMTTEISDNAYLERSYHELSSLIEKYRCKNSDAIESLELSPTSIKFNSAARYVLMLQNTTSFNWVQTPARERLLLGGIRLVELRQINTPVELHFNYAKILHFAVQLVLLFLSFCFFSIKAYRSNKL